MACSVTRWCARFWLGISLTLLLMLAAVGCGGGSAFGNVEKELNQGIASMPYEEARLRWGEPLSISKGDKHFTAYWLKKDNIGFLCEKLYLTFDNKEELLRAYRYNKDKCE